MTGITSNLLTEEQQAATATVKGKEEDIVVMTHAAAPTTQREQEALLVDLATARKTLDEARAHECAAALTWEKEKANAHHLEQQLTFAHGIVIIQDDNDDRFVNVSSNLDAALITHLHAQAADIQKI
jgi:hypothetical protein